MESAQEVAFNGDWAPVAAAADYESAGKSLFMCEHARAKQGADCSATGEKMEVSGKRGGRGRAVTCQKAVETARPPMTFQTVSDVKLVTSKPQSERRHLVKGLTFASAVAVASTNVRNIGFYSVEDFWVWTYVTCLPVFVFNQFSEEMTTGCRTVHHVNNILVH